MKQKSVVLTAFPLWCCNVKIYCLNWFLKIEKDGLRLEKLDLRIWYFASVESGLLIIPVRLPGVNCKVTEKVFFENAEIRHADLHSCVFLKWLFKAVKGNHGWTVLMRLPFSIVMGPQILRFK